LILEKYVGALLILLLGKMSKFTWQGDAKLGEKVMIVSWHENLIPLSYYHRKTRHTVIVSMSKDGELIAGPLELLGYKVVRGSSGRGGMKALKKALQIDNSISFAVDGPRGPVHKCKEGAFYAALKKQIPIIPIKVEFSNSWCVPTWDKMRVQKPFSRVKVIYGKGIYIKSKNDIKKSIELVENVLKGDINNEKG